MSNKVNLPQFQDILRRATINFSIDNVGMSFAGDRFEIGMRSSNAIVILKGENNVISGISHTDTWDMNFSEPNKNVKAYFDLIIPDENDEAMIQMKDEKIIVKSGTQKSNLFFCSEHLISKFMGSGPKTDGEEVYSMDITQEFVDTFNLVKKVAGGFGKIYINVDDGVASIESTDKTNSFSNGMKMAIGESGFDDVTICFDFKTFNNIMTLIGGDAIEFKIRVGYIPRSNGGMISFIKNDESEKYFLMSKREEHNVA
ncbi:MAG: hypothetical protein KAS32_04015 [Candidatus Peribacteraceae bacterium]|nr:hypothetical protein [Candidatus Peribacteraceae bacterium]